MLSLTPINIVLVVITLIIVRFLVLNFITKYVSQGNSYQEVSIGTGYDLVLYHNKRNIITSLPICFYACLVLFFLLGTVYNATYHTPLLLFAKVVFAMLFSLFLFGIIYGLVQLARNKPVAILNKDGIWLKEFNFIPWDNIATVDTYRIPTTPMETIRIDILDSTIVYQHANVSGKVRMFWAKLFNYPPVLLSNIDATNDDVITFSRQYLSSRQSKNI